MIKKSKLCKNCKNGNVVKTIGGSKILKRTSYDNKPLDLGSQGFPAVGARFLSKSSQDSNKRGIRRYKGINNNIILEAITFNNNNNNNLREGRPASTSRGVTLQQVGHHGQARNNFSCFQFWVLPIPASRPMSSGHFMCMVLPPTEDARWDVRKKHGWRDGCMDG